MLFSTDINFSHFLPFQTLIWTIIFGTDFEIRGISEKEKESFERVPPAKLLLNLIFEAPKAQKKKIYKFWLKPPKLPEGPLWASSSRRVVSHHLFPFLSPERWTFGFTFTLSFTFSLVLLLIACRGFLS